MKLIHVEDKIETHIKSNLYIQVLVPAYFKVYSILQLELHVLPSTFRKLQTKSIPGFYTDLMHEQLRAFLSALKLIVFTFNTARNHRNVLHVIDCFSLFQWRRQCNQCYKTNSQVFHLISQDSRAKMGVSIALVSEIHIYNTGTGFRQGRKHWLWPLSSKN